MSYARAIDRRGLGGAVYSPTIQAVQSTAVSAATAIGAAAGGPLGAAAASAIAEVGVMLSDLFAGCGNTCVEATSIVNQAEPLLQQMLSAYMSAPVHYASNQASYLSYFDSVWSNVQNACSNPALGSAGQHCISDRQRGSCAYKTSPGGWSQDSSGEWSYTYPGANGSGDTCWNWFVGYRDPVANDPTVVQDPVPGAAALSSLLSSVGFSSNATLFGLPVTDLLLIAAGLLAIKFWGDSL